MSQHKASRTGLVTTALLLATITLAFRNEPDGFRGITWGTPFSAHAKEMTLVEKGEDYSFYLRKGDKMSIEGAELEQLAYRYWKGRFYGVMIQTLGAGNKSALIEAFQAKFGAAFKFNPYLEKYYWFGRRTRISLDCSRLEGKCTAIVFSTKWHAKQEKAKKKKKKAAGAAKDF